MPKIQPAYPVVQVAIDTLNMDDALRVAEAAVRAGVDWLEVGTPLVTYEGVRAISALHSAFPHMPILCDYKAMDGVKKYFVECGRRGGSIATVCGASADAMVKMAVEGGAEAGVMVICDLIACSDVVQRAREVAALGVDAVYVHWGSDEKALDPSRDPQRDVPAVVEAVKIPVGTATFSVEDGVRAVQSGCSIMVIGYPLIGGSDIEEQLKRYVQAVKSA